MLDNQNKFNLWYAISATMTVCLSFTFFTYSITIFNAVLPYFRIHLLPEYNRFIVVFLVAVPILSAIVGTFTAGSIGPKIGRRKILIVADIVSIVGVILTLIAKFGTILAGRILIGLAIGVSSQSAPLYYTELVPVRYRGEFTNAPTIFGAIGILIATLLGLIMPQRLARNEIDGTWRVLIAFTMVPPIIRLICLLFVFRYETPYFYVNQRKYVKAAKGLKNIYNDDILERIKEIAKEREYLGSGGEVSFLKLRTKKFRKALLICCIGTSLQYLSGLIFILVYTGDIYSQNLPKDSVTPNILGVTTAMINFFAAITSIWTTKRFGRRPLMVWGTFLCGVIFLIYGIISVAAGPGHLVAKIFLVFWPIPWNLSLGSVLLVVVAETLPDSGVAIATISGWVFAYLTLQFYPEMRDNLHLGYSFIMLGIITVVGALILWQTIVESKGKNKDEILQKYSGVASKDRQAAAEEEPVPPMEMHIEVQEKVDAVANIEGINRVKAEAKIDALARLENIDQLDPQAQLNALAEIEMEANINMLNQAQAQPEDLDERQTLIDVEPKDPNFVESKGLADVEQ